MSKDEERAAEADADQYGLGFLVLQKVPSDKPRAEWKRVNPTSVRIIFPIGGDPRHARMAELARENDLFRDLLIQAGVWMNILEEEQAGMTDGLRDSINSALTPPAPEPSPAKAPEVSE